jgi:hypothetical protein
MRIAEMLQAIANWLESPDNEALLLADHNEDCLKIVAESCVLAAGNLKRAASAVDSIEPQEESLLTEESLDKLASLADIFDASGDVELKKQASVIDELLLTIAANPEIVAEKKAANLKKVDEIKKKYSDVREELRELNRISDSEEAIKKSKMTENTKINDKPLQTRSCPDHPGVLMSRVGNYEWKCNLDKKTYNYSEGYELMSGEKIPGAGVENQNKHSLPTQAIFDTRYERLQTNKA